MADKKWMFDKSTKPPKEGKESPMEEMMEHSSPSVKGKDSPMSSGFRDLDASCADCANLSDDQSSCSKVELPSSFSPYNSICSKHFVPKESNDSQPKPEIKMDSAPAPSDSPSEPVIGSKSSQS